MSTRLSTALWLSFLAACCFVQTALAGKTPMASKIFDTCTGTAGLYQFYCVDPDDYYLCMCKGAPTLGTVLGCVHQMTTSESEIQSIYKTAVFYCSEYGSIDVTVEELEAAYANATHYFVDASTVNATDIQYAPLILPQESLDDYMRTVSAFDFNLWTGELFGGIMMAYWLLVVLIGSVINFTQRAAPKFFMSLNKPWMIKFRQKFTMPALFGYKHSTPVFAGSILSWCTPNRGQTIVLLGYVVLNIILTIVRYDIFEPNYYFESNSLQICRYVADRTGIISFVHFPALFLFAGRNNFFLWATGWSYDTFNLYHRWIARGMFLHAFIHSVCYSVYGAIYHEYAEYWVDAYWRWGVVATCAGGIMLFLALHYFRSRCYELFLITHIVLSAIFIVGCWYHCITLGYMQYVYTAIAIWAFDRAVRIARILWSGISAKGDLELHDSGLIKIKVDYSQRWKYYPGCYVFIHVMRPWKFWESHPFTVFQSVDPEDEGRLILCASVKSGITKNVARYLARQPENKARIGILVNGPYGHRIPVDGYDTVAYIAGGIGVTATYASAADLAGRNHNGQHIIFIWIVSSASTLEPFRKEIDQLANNEKVEVRIYVTNNKSGDSTPENTSSDGGRPSESEIEKSSSASTGYRMHDNVKPNMFDEIPSIIRESIGSVAVVACGPPSLNDDIRKSVNENLGNGKGKVDYYEEAFSW